MEVPTVHGNELRLFIGKYIPTNLTYLAPDIAAVGTRNQLQ